MNSRSNRFQKRKHPNKGFFRYAFIVLISAAVLLSILTLFLSRLAIQKDNALKEQLGGTGIPHLEVRTLRKQIDQTNDDGSKKVPVEETITPEQRTSKVEVEPLKPNVLPADNPIGGTSNSDIYQPPKTGKRLLTYGRFGGRLNNQLFQFITSLQHAKVLKRTFVVPNEVRDVDWTGMFDAGFGIWDLDSLNNAYDIDWTTGLSAEFALTIPKNCVLTPAEGRRLLNSGPKSWEKWDEMCPDVIDIAGSTGLLFCDQQHQFCGDYEAKMEAYKIYEHIKLSASLLQYIPSKREEFKNKGYDELAIHSRRAGEGGYDWELCVNGNAKTCRGHISGSDQDKFCNTRTMKGNCAAWLDLDWQIKSKSALKKNQREYKFVLASDGTHDWNIDFKNQFVVANNTDWLLALERKVNDDADPEKMIETMAVSALSHSKLKRQKDLSRMRGKLDALTATLLDLFSLVDSKYLLGAYYSTLSLNACYFRGLDRVYDSNMCWMLMHPNSKHAIIPPFQETVNVKDPNLDDHLPAALMSDVEHAFVRSDDGNFIAIDRYLVQFKGKQVIGILGDGLVPITIMENDNGEETVRADFTCAYGDEHDSPATVILMKGNQSYNEHYYKRGEKYNTPFSTNGDRFRTMIILCEKLNYDRSLSRHPPLMLKSPDGKFSLTIGSTFQRPVGQVMNAKSTVNHDKLVHCLNPAYGLKDPRWIIEYLEYHRAVGVAHVHVYNVDMHSPEVQSALQIYRDEKFITRHDWSGKASGDYTTKKTYEHAKWAAQTDCALRSRGIYDYALFSDLDEIAVGGYPGGHLAPALEMCQEAKEKRGKIACSFNSNTVSSIYTKLNDEEELAMKDKLILERYDRIEAKPHCPSNCKCLGNNCSIMDRKFHSGRQKYIVNVRDLTIPPRPMWTHALARDYDEMNKIMEVLPDEVMHVRHYQGHWYKNNNLLNSMEEKEAPLSTTLMDTVRSSISGSRDKKYKFSKRLMYAKAKDTALLNGVEW
eukprot:CAMPEP_0172307836 /NCGR_PEP_ID=MMETSP1058-20130122/8599_1 /TAXON_ID=83371 /ORGANISM="Detonula confervacea, Strain CCMP 353" /LENGTH=991 /DNA_ID=CAMNT_0013020113 /DNA_START=141 /DNA_END=3113 /DNA_ORIENTATION=-